MEEEGSSWIRRTKFPHTVFHRVDSLRMDPSTFDIHPERNSSLKSRPGDCSSDQKSSPPCDDSQIQINPVAINSQRSLSPVPQTTLSDSFREARSEKKRFSTPHPRGKDHDSRNMGKFFHKDSHDKKPSNRLPNSSPLMHLASLKGHDKSKYKRECSWTKYFDHAGVRVSAVGAADEFCVDMTKLFLGLRFAHGAHSRLYHGSYKDEPVAVKIIRPPDDDENEGLITRLENQFEREVTFLSRLRHPNVIKFIAAGKLPPVFCVITEYLSEGSLRAYLHKLEQKSLPLRKLNAIALDVAYGMEYVHSQGVIHRDLKPENILINQDFRMKIADFGIACGEAYCDSLVDDPGTYRWMAPEMIKKKPYGRKVDVYSFGLILWEMVAGTIPYDNMNPIQAAFAVVNKNLRPVIPRDCPPAMAALIDQCWSLHPDKRPEFWQIVKVLEEFDFSLAQDGTLNILRNLSCHDHKKGLRHWIQKLGPPQPSKTPVPKPKFM